MPNWWAAAVGAVVAALALGAVSVVAPFGSPEYVATLTVLALVVGAVRVVIGLFRLGGVAGHIRHRPFVDLRRYSRVQSDIALTTFGLTLVLGPPPSGPAG